MVFSSRYYCGAVGGHELLLCIHLWRMNERPDSVGGSQDVQENNCVVCLTPHALSPDALSPDAFSPCALSSCALSPNGLRNT